MRWAVLLLSTAACGARLDVPPINSLDAASPAEPDAALVIDAPPDARACAGGQGAMAVADGSCVIFFAAPASFDNAAAQCAADNTQLAILNSAERDAAARALIGMLDVFIGLTDSTDEGTFVWIDGTPLVFDNFAGDEPNNANGAFQEDCVMYSGTRAGWDDRPCSNNVPGIGGTPGEYPFLCMF